MTLRDVDSKNNLQMNIIYQIEQILKQRQVQGKGDFPATKLTAQGDYEFVIGTNQYHAIVSELKQLEYVKVQELPANIVHLFINHTDDSASTQFTLEYIKQLLPNELWESLYHYQRQGVLYAVNKGGKVLIGDEMGLGKTIQGTYLQQFSYRTYLTIISLSSNLDCVLL